MFYTHCLRLDIASLVHFLELIDLVNQQMTTLICYHLHSNMLSVRNSIFKLPSMYLSKNDSRDMLLGNYSVIAAKRYRRFP